MMVIPLVVAALQVVPVAADSARPEPPPRGPWVYTVDRPGPPLYGFAAWLPIGAANDPDGGSGAAWVHARLLENDLRRHLRFSAASVSVEVGRFSTAVSILSPAENATRDFRELHSLLSGAHPLEAADFERARSELLEQLRFEAGAPVRQFEEEQAQVIYDGRWGGSVHGRPEDLQALDWEAFRSWVDRVFDRERLLLVRLGPADTTFAAPGPPPPAFEQPSRPAWAWNEGRHERLERPITNAWVTVDAPVRADLDPTALDLLVTHLREILSPDPPDPGIFSARVEVLESPEGPVLSVTATVAPESAERWARRLEDAVRLEDLASWIDRGQFSWQRRRFRNDWLRRESSPDRAALRVARDLLAGHPARDPLAEAARLQGADLEALVAAVGPPRVLVYGPGLAEGPGS